MNIQILKDIENTIGGPVIIVREIANNGKSIVCEAISPIGQVAIKTVISNSEFYLNSFSLWSTPPFFPSGAHLLLSHLANHNSIED